MKDGQQTILQTILLLGPTGAGKTPLGDWLERNSLWGKPCHHFDFGANLRAVAAAGPSDSFARDEIQFLNRVLTQGVLLEDESFHLAAKILHAFVARHGVQPEHWLILNGLPRHVGQAQALEQAMRVCVLIQLECGPRVVRERLRRDAGGDRAARSDDHNELVAQKLVIYEERTRPLVTHYRQRGARLIAVPVDVDTQPPEIAMQLERLPRLI
jgi:adenylate kinase